MWRSLFYSVGIALFVTGLQGLVVEHVMVPKNTKLQKLVRKILSDDKPAAQNGLVGQPVGVGGIGNPDASALNWNNQPRQMANLPPANQQQPQGYGTNTGSRFGPSRFAGPRYGTGYGGARVSSSPQSGSSFGGFQNQTQRQPNAQLAGFRGTANAPQTTQRKPIALQKFMVREWMPWSLLASGAIIFLYTHTLHKRRTHE